MRGQVQSAMLPESPLDLLSILPRCYVHHDPVNYAV